MMGGMGGGGMMGGGQNSVGNWQQMYRAYQLIYTIQQTVEPDSWYDTGEGDGTIDQYGESKLIIYQTPEVHAQIKELLDKLREGLGQQIAIETRFLLVTENFLEDIGLDTNIPKLKLGGNWGGGAVPGTITIPQDSVSHVTPTDTGVPGSLGGAFTNPALGTTLTYDLDDLQVEFILRATQAHGNSKQLQAPRATVLNGEMATMQVTTAKRLKTGSQFNSETIQTAGGNPITNYWWEVENEDIDTGIMLSIGPVITADKKYVILRVQTYLTDLIAQDTQTSIGFTNQGEPFEDTYINPTTQTSSVQTRVTVPDRGTVMLGGLTITASRELESGAPILSKVPVLGRFFSNRSIVDDKLMLLILVKPTIILQHEAEEDAIGALARQ
ncbi:MAG: type II and III secretion system protein, partial [Phycisphaerae bacterium]|nr:type II and III secretion system protein [Phycisphaerae bacterium]